MKTFDNIPNKLVTDTDGNKHWISPSISVDAILTVTGRVLVVKRSEAMSNPNKWCLPCGFMDWNETPLNACIRELYEEVGVDIREHDLLNNKSTTDPYNRPYAENGTALQFVFMLADYPDLKLDTEECVAFRWVSLDELHELEWAFGHDELIKRILD